MRTTRTALVVAAVLAIAPALLSASDRAEATKKETNVVRTASTETSGSQFAALKGVKAQPMSSSELKAVKGLHVHFFTPSKNVVDTPFGPIEGIHLAGDVKTENNWSDLFGQGDVANSYHGLCKAAVNGSAVFINPGGGCGF